MYLLCLYRYFEVKFSKNISIKKRGVNSVYLIRVGQHDVCVDEHFNKTLFNIVLGTECCDSFVDIEIDRNRLLGKIPIRIRG